MKEKRGIFYKQPDDDFKDIIHTVWEFSYKGYTMKFSIDDEISDLPKDRLERLNFIWSNMVKEAFNKGFETGKDHILDMPLRRILKDHDRL